MKKADAQIFLYAKGWYKITDQIVDLKKILGHRSGLDPKHISNSDISLVLLDIVYECIQEKGDPKSNFLSFIRGLDPDNRWMIGAGKDDDYFSTLVKSCLSAIRLAAVDDLSLKDVDPTILPLKG